MPSLATERSVEERLKALETLVAELLAKQAARDSVSKRPRSYKEQDDSN